MDIKTVNRRSNFYTYIVLVCATTTFPTRSIVFTSCCTENST